MALLALGLAAAGALAATVLAGNSASADTTSTATETVPTGTTATTVPATTETTVPPTTTAPPPTTPKPKPQPVRLPARVTIGGVHVGGLSPDAAFAAVRTAFRSPLVLVVGKRHFSVSPDRLGAVAYAKAAISQARAAGAGSRVPLRVNVRGADVRAFVDELAPKIDSKPVDARVVLRNLHPFVTESRTGEKLDRLKAVRTITFALSRNRRSLVPLPVRQLKPSVTTEGFGPVIVIRRSSNRLYLYNGSKFVRRFGVATGQSYYPTPLGRFDVVVKWENPWWYPPPSPWAKGLKPIPPGLGNPLGTRWMGLSAPGVGIHGTPDSASIGYSASHGCIRMLISDAEWLFQHVEVGTQVFIVPA